MMRVGKMKKSIMFLAVFLFSLVMVVASGNHDFKETEKLIEQKISCSQLTEEQLEHIGDYYMEQMHPGEAHEAMDEMMGGEGSESLRQVHINMGKAFYCGEHGAMSGNMMDMMMGRSGGMMGSGGLMNYPSSYSGKTSYGYNVIMWVIAILILFVLILIIVLLVRQLQKPKGGHKRK
jgi:hypothetical protein